MHERFFLFLFDFLYEMPLEQVYFMNDPPLLFNANYCSQFSSCLSACLFQRGT